jgi:hypothetical protein
MLYINLKKVIQEFGMEKISEFTEEMKSAGSLHLYDKLDADIKEQVDSILLTLRGDQAIYYFSEGRKAGKFPPLLAIKQWAKDHDLDPFRDKKGRFITFDSRAYLIGRKIAKKGTKEHAIHFIAKIWKLNDEDKEKFMTAYREDVKAELKTLVDEFNK